MGGVGNGSGLDWGWGETAPLPSLGAWLEEREGLGSPPAFAAAVHDFHDRFAFLPTYLIIPQVLALVYEHPNLTRFPLPGTRIGGRRWEGFLRYSQVATVECRWDRSDRKWSRSRYSGGNERCGRCPHSHCLICLPAPKFAPAITHLGSTQGGSSIAGNCISRSGHPGVETMTVS